MFHITSWFVHEVVYKLLNSLVSDGGSCNVSPRSVAIVKLIEELRRFLRTATNPLLTNQSQNAYRTVLQSSYKHPAGDCMSMLAFSLAGYTHVYIGGELAVRQGTPLISAVHDDVHV